jgi:imidazolonepropionase-like amidohydrolase
VAPPDGSIAFVGVNVIPMTRNLGVLRNQVVVVRDGRIESVGNEALTPVPPGAVRIDGRGKYLIPGLADMHVHLEYFEDPGMLRLFTSNGVTFVRSMDGRPRILDWKKRIASGDLEGPSIITAGPLLDGSPPVLPDNTIVRNAAEGKAAVADQKSAGYDFIKVYTNLSTKAYEAILAEAKELGVPVAGHVPRNSTIIKALQSHASIEHLTDFDELIEAETSLVRGRFHWSKLYLGMESDSKKITAAARRVAKADVAVVPTLVQAEHALANTETLATWLNRDELKLVPPDVRSFWEDRVRSASERIQGADWEIVERGAANRMALVKALDAAGATLLAGTDTPNPFVVPGVSIHRELELLVRAGLTPKEALATATREAAIFVGQGAEWGTIEAGKRADLLLLDANPLESIGATAKIVRVMVRGRF